MEGESETRLVALFASLAGAEAALHALEGDVVPYPRMKMDTYGPENDDYESLTARATEAGITTPERVWSLALSLDQQTHNQAIEKLREQGAFAFAHPDEIHLPVDSVEQGAIAWRHYVFETPHATDAVGEYAGTTGTTGVISSGVFTEGAVAEGNPPAKRTPDGDEKPSDAEKQPNSDTMEQEVSTSRSRPDTQLKES